MTRNNFALLSVLYDNTDANLYGDVYFPIIKYSLALLFSEQSNKNRFYDLSSLQKEIETNFGIIIPLQVLKQAVKGVAHKNKEIKIKLYDQGNSFQIEQAWNTARAESIEEKLDATIDRLRELDFKFEEYLKRENICSDKSFTNFFSDNCEEMFKYLDSLDSIPIVDENYIHLANFLKELEDTDKDLFYISNNVFWSSIIAAFLKRNVDLNIKPSNKIEYYLDTSLILSLIGLNSEVNVEYANELVDVIKNAGHIVKAHPMTLKEISNILQSVESEGAPRPNTPIEDAYYRLDLSPSKILQIRNSLNNTIDRKGVVIDSMSPSDLEKTINTYRNKAITKRLEETRGGAPTNENSIRDIHDVFMHELVKSKRGNVSHFEKLNAHFISLNTDLQQFIIREEFGKHKFSTVLHPAKIISSLWIYNSECSLIKDTVLTETITRCMILNSADVKYKLRLISKYINIDDVDTEAYKAMYIAIIDRSNKVLREIENLEVNETKNKDKGNKQEAEKIIQDIIQIASKEYKEKKESTTQAVIQMEKIRQSYKKEYRNLIIEIKEERKVAKMNEASLKSKIKDITSLIEEKENEFNAEEERCKKSISFYNERIWIFVESVILIALVTLVILFIREFINARAASDYKGFFEYFKSKESLGYCIGIVVTSFLFILRARKESYLFNIKNVFLESQKLQKEQWIRDNTKYTDLKKEIEMLRNERESLLSEE